MKWIVIAVLSGVAAFNSLTAGEITGMVLDAQTFEGISYARVTVYVSLDPNGFDKFRTKQLYVLTGADGHFRVTGLPASWSRLSCEKPGYLDANAESDWLGQVHVVGDGGPAHVDLHLLAAGSISGSVVDARGFPCGKPMFSYSGRVLLQSAPALTISARTDELGGFRINDVQPGRYTLAVSIGFPIVTTMKKLVYYPGSVDLQHAEWFDFQPGDKRRIECRLRSISAK